ncbi:MAG: hypothetical protein NTW65_09400 [Deltaproteobacteria bacterium]|nr:hypothetical protein [Deltaproteobacteria bacterium]
MNIAFAKKLKDVWEKNIKEDYKKELLSYEADLQASLYMHLREKLDENYRIYLEQKIVPKKVKPDIILCNYKEKEGKIDCILELKYAPHYKRIDLSDMGKLEKIRKYYKYRGGKCKIWIEGPNRTDKENDKYKWNDEHWIKHLIDEDTIFGFVLIAPETTFKDNASLINEFLEKDKNYLVLAGKTYITQEGECDFRVLSGKEGV